MGQVLWVLDHLADLRADFLVLVRKEWEEVLEMAFPHFLELAWRMPAYGGVMTARAEAMAHREQRDRPRRRVRQVDGDQQAVEADPLLAAAISFN